MLSDLLHKGLEQPYGDVVGSAVIISVAREISLDLIISHKSGLITDGFYLCVFDRAQGIDDM